MTYSHYHNRRLIATWFFISTVAIKGFSTSQIGDSTNLIPNSDFEINGQPTLQTWIADSILTGFMQDTPPGGGKWSIWLSPGWMPRVGYARTYISGQSGIGVYRLTVWMKNINGWEGSASFGRWAEENWVRMKQTYCDSSTWTQISLADTLSLQTTDTIAVQLSAGWAELSAGRTLFDLVRLERILTSVAPDRNFGGVPAQFTLDQNYPNPFNPSTTIRYALPERSQVLLSVFNTLGQQVATLVEGEQEVGYHEVKFGGSGLSSGVYFYRLQAGELVQTRKLLLTK